MTSHWLIFGIFDCPCPALEWTAVTVAGMRLEVLAAVLTTVHPGIPTPKTPVRYVDIDVGRGVKLGVAVAGSGPVPVLLLHGFPECSWFWRGLIDPLLHGPKGARYTLYMPDLRGFNGSSGTASGLSSISAYNCSKLTADAVSLIEAVGDGGAVHVVGHDWGGMMIGWLLAGQHPQLVRSLTAMNSPHPSVFDALLRTDPVEDRRSSYQFYFDTLAADGMDTAKFFAGAEWFDSATEAAYRTAYARSGGPRGGLNWYRSNIFGGRMGVTNFTKDMVTTFPKGMRVDVPTLVLWGLQDGAFDNEANLKGLNPLVKQLTVITRGYENTSHWIAQEQPIRVAADVRAFIDNIPQHVINTSANESRLI